MKNKIDFEKNYSKIVWICFYGITIFKIILMGLFSSDYQDRMFIPFIDTFLTGKTNPYEYYYSNQLLSSFPYPPMMLLIESVGGGIYELLNPSSLFVRNFLFKIPLLFFDIVGFFYLKKICRKRIKYIFILYFMSPIVLFATYVHGQLDIIPTVLLIISVYYLMRNENSKDICLFSLFLAFSIGTKFHILAAVPILFLFLYKKRGAVTTLFCAGIVIVVTALIVCPFWGDGFLNYVIMNKEQSVITRVFLNYDSIRLFIPILAVVIIYLKVYQLNNMNRDLLLSILGVLFAVFLVCVPPMPAWFVWIVPFIAIYFITNDKNKYKLLSIYAMFNVLYLVYFIFFHRTQFVDIYLLGHSLQSWKIENTVLKDIMFTVMAGFLLTLVFEMYTFGVASNALYKRMNTPFAIGIAGDSGTGKSELLEKLEKLLGGNKNILYLEGDGDHRWGRGDPNWEMYTHLDPKANFLYQQAKDMMTLKAGSAVKRVDYDHDTGRFTKYKRMVPKPYIILCGLHSLYLPQLRKVLDLKIYMDTDENLRRFWKIQRDINKRGYSGRDIIAQIEKRISDAQKYIYPQKEYADLRITYYDKTLQDYYDINHKPLLSLRLSVSVSIDVENILTSLERYGVKSEQRYCEDLKYQDISFDGADMQGKEIDFQRIAHESIPQFDELFTEKVTWEKTMEGILELFIMTVISTKMRGE